MKNWLVSFLWFWARLQLKSGRPLVIAVTGSAGKTSTKEMIWSVLNSSAKFKGQVGKSFGNLNTKLGVPLALLQIKAQEPDFLDWILLIWWLPLKYLLLSLGLYNYPKILVLEVAADQKGDIEFVASRLRPHIGILTNLGPSHLVYFSSLGKLAQEKLSLFKYISPQGLAVLPQKGLKKEYLDEIVCHKQFFDQTDLSAAARLIGRFFELRADKVAAGVKTAPSMEHRLQLIESSRGFLIIDDTYNANPVSVTQALEFLQKVGHERKAQRKVVVLADMRELGEEAKIWHLRIGKKVSRVVDMFISFGDLARYYQADIYFDSKPKLAEYLLRELVPGDIILIKGSRAMKMEEVVEKIKN